MPNRPKHQFEVISDLNSGVVFDHCWMRFCTDQNLDPVKLAEKYTTLRPFPFEPTPNGQFLTLHPSGLLCDPAVLEYLKPFTYNNNSPLIRLRDCHYNNKSKMWRLPRSATQPEFGQFIYLHHVLPFYSRDTNWAILFGLDPNNLPEYPRLSLAEAISAYSISLGA